MVSAYDNHQYERMLIVGTDNTPTYNGVAMTELTMGTETWSTPWRGQMRIWYMVNPPTGTNSFRFTAHSVFTTNGYMRFHYEFSTFYNVDQTTPFKIQLNGATDPAGILVEGETAGYATWNTTNPSDGTEQEMKFEKYF